MIAESSLLGPHLQAFFSQYLRVQKRASPETVASYRDTFQLLLQFVRSTRRIEPLLIAPQRPGCSARLELLGASGKCSGITPCVPAISVFQPFDPSFAS